MTLTRSRRSGRALASLVGVLAVLVGGVVTFLAAASGGPACSGSGVGQADPVCGQLVRTMAERVGIAAAAATAIVVLTMVGLSRLASGSEASGSRPEVR